MLLLVSVSTDYSSDYWTSASKEENLTGNDYNNFWLEGNCNFSNEPNLMKKVDFIEYKTLAHQSGYISHWSYVGTPTTLRDNQAAKN